MANRSANFIDKKTGEEFFISKYSMSFRGSEKYWKDSSTGKEVVNPKTGTPLEFIEREDYDPRKVRIVRNEGSIGDKYERVQKHFDTIAENHNKSDEVKEMKFKAVEKQMGTSIAKMDLEIQEGRKKVKILKK